MESYGVLITLFSGVAVTLIAQIVSHRLAQSRDKTNRLSALLHSECVTFKAAFSQAQVEAAPKNRTGV